MIYLLRHVVSGARRLMANMYSRRTTSAWMEFAPAPFSQKHLTDLAMRRMGLLGKEARDAPGGAGTYHDVCEEGLPLYPEDENCE